MDPIATKSDVETHFKTHGTGEITEIKLMNGFGFIEYSDAMDARDVVPGKSLPLSMRCPLDLTHMPSQHSVRSLSNPTTPWHVDCEY